MQKVNVFICYETNKWPLELSSGMEKFIASLAIRVALIKITNLPSSVIPEEASDFGSELVGFDQRKFDDD
jgi:hypothetical protein